MARIERRSPFDEAADRGDWLMALAAPVALYGFQRAPKVRFVTPDRGWKGWFEDWPTPLIAAGIRDQHLHNPFGLHDLHEVPGRDERVMHIDQFELSYCRGWLWLANRVAFAQVVRDIHQRGGTVRAYVGSPLVVRQSPQATYLPKCSPGSRGLSMQLRLLSRLGLCGTPRQCRCWDRLVRFHIAPLVDGGVDAIGFDNSADFHPGDCMDRLVRSLLPKRFEVMLEPWPRRDRDYPPVSWIIREMRYQRTRLGLQPDDAPVESVTAKIYRSLPAADTQEFSDINKLREDHGEARFPTFQDLVDAVRNDGHTPLIRAPQLKSADIT